MGKKDAEDDEGGGDDVLGGVEWEEHGEHGWGDRAGVGGWGEVAG